MLVSPVCNQESAFNNVRYHAQHTDIWCWAAVASSITDYFTGAYGEDCDFLTQYFYINGNWTNCCSFPQTCYRTGMGMGEISMALYQVAGLYSHIMQGPLTECQLRQELASGRPIIIGMTKTMGHVAIITGYDSTGYTVQDPYSGEFPSIPYVNLLSNPTLGNWTSTLFAIGREDVCYQEPESTCDAGTSSDCECEEGSAGEKTCGLDGSWSECVCSDADACGELYRCYEDWSLAAGYPYFEYAEWDDRNSCSVTDFSTDCANYIDSFAECDITEPETCELDCEVLAEKCPMSGTGL